jgi:hypothetical protein
MTAGPKIESLCYLRITNSLDQKVRPLLTKRGAWRYKPCREREENGKGQSHLVKCSLQIKFNNPLMIELEVTGDIESGVRHLSLYNTSVDFRIVSI